MANTKLTKVQINSVDVSSYLLKWDVEENFGNPVYPAKISLVSTVTSAVTLAAYQRVEIWEGYTTSTDLKIFDGYVESYEPEPGRIAVKAFNKLYACNRTLLGAVKYDKNLVGNPIYSAGKYSDAFYDLVTTYAGLSATNGTTIQDSGTALIITQLNCFQKSVKERIDRISEALDWHYFYKASDDKVYFQPKQFTTNATTLTVGGNVVNVPKWKYDKTDLINDLRIDGLYQDSGVTQSFTGNGSTTVFTLSYTPVGDVALYYSAAKNYETTAKTEQERKVLGVTGSSSGSFDFTVDKINRQLTTSGFTAAAGTNNLLAEYVASIPNPVHMIDDTSITSYGRSQRNIVLTDVLTVADAESRARMVLDKFKNPFQSTELHVAHNSSFAATVGQSIQVVDAVNSPSVSSYFTIFGITRRYPGGYDILSVGNREFDPPEMFINMFERLHSLEQEDFNENGVAVELRDATMDLTLEPHSLVVDTYLANDSFILDHSVNGVLYSSSEAFTLVDMESAAAWAQEPIVSIAITLTNDSTANHFWIGTQGVNMAWVGTSGLAIMQNTTALPTLATVTGVGTGTPSRGTIGVWCYTSTPSSISALSLIIGNDSSNYHIYAGKQYAWGVYGQESSFALNNALLTYVVFDLDAPASVVGTVNWASIDYTNLAATVTAAGNITFDYLTASKSNVIGANGLGDRRTLYSTTTYSY